MNIVNILSMCNNNAMKRVFSISGNLFDIIKIVIPILIIVIGTIDLVKAMIANNQEDTKKSQSMFIKRLIIAVCIFFVFPIVSFLMNLLGENMDNQCMQCFTNPNDKSKCYFTTTNNSSDDGNAIIIDENNPDNELLSEAADR